MDFEERKDIRLVRENEIRSSLYDFVLRLSGPKIEKGRRKREAEIFRLLYKIETDVADYIPGFLVGEFLAFDEDEQKSKSIINLFKERLEIAGHTYGRAGNELGFYNADRYADADVQKFEEAFRRNIKDRKLFSNFIRASRLSLEKQAIMIYLQLEKDNPIYDELDRCTGSRRVSKAIKLIRIDAATLSGCDVGAIKKNFDKLIDQLGFDPASPPFDPDELREYLLNVLDYAPASLQDADKVIVYCPASFLTEEPPANFWGLFCAGGLLGIDHAGASDLPRAVESFVADVLQIRDDVTAIMSQITGLHAERRREMFVRKARAAAHSAIMSRNMSHNIGSHVSPRTTIDLIVKRVLEEKGADATVRDAIDHPTLKKIKLLKWKLDEYIQKKADFLAEITTEPLVTMKPAYFYREVIAPFISNGLLMDNIGKNEGVGYIFDGGPDQMRNRLKVKVLIDGAEIRATYKCSGGGKDDECSFEYPAAAFPYSLHCPKHDAELQLYSLCEDAATGFPAQDLEIALPGPLGEFAFYSFLENFIRNSAKHNRAALSRQSGDDLEVTISVSTGADRSERESEFCRVEISDNFTRNGSLSIDGVAGGTKRSTVEILNDHLNADVIDPVSGRLEKRAWGLAEMRICAALLNGTADLDKPDHNVLEAVATYDGTVAYRFRLMKSRQICAVLPDEIPEDRARELRRSGVYVFPSMSEFVRQAEGSRSASSCRIFVLSTDSISADEVRLLTDRDGVSAWLPFRVILTKRSGAELPESLQRSLVASGRAVIADEPPDLQESPDRLIHWAWRTWVTKRFFNRGAGAEAHYVDLFLDQTRYASPTAEWDQFGRRFNEIETELSLQIFGKNLSPQRLHAGGVHVLYDRHGVIALRGPVEGYMEKHSYIFLDKRTSDFSILFSPKFPVSETGSWPIPWELAEAGLLRILVVDERIAERAFDLVGDNDIVKISEKVFGCAPLRAVPKFHLAWAARVYLCTHIKYLSGAEALHESLSPHHGFDLGYGELGRDGRQADPG